MIDIKSKHCLKRDEPGLVLALKTVRARIQEWECIKSDKSYPFENEVALREAELIYRRLKALQGVDD